MSKNIKDRIEKLKQVINHHRYLYHVLDKQEISEAALDSLKKELADLEQQYPQYITPDSPTQRVAGKPLDGFKKVKHEILQWSFDDAFTKEDILAFDNRVTKLLDGQKPTYVCELKIDGFKIVLTYKQGVLVTAATRGDGKVGEDVTANIKTIEAIPLKLEKDSVDLVAEGEVWMSKKDFSLLNKEQEKLGKPIYANPRNVAAGTIRQLDPQVVANRKLSSFVYDLEKINSKLPATQVEELELLKTLGFPVNKYFQFCSNIDEVINYWQKWQTKKDSLPYLIDGVVVKVNEREYQEKLGYTGKSPRFGIAFKFSAEQATTVVEDIILQVGRTGVITPVAKLRPVLLSGSTVSRATLHNEDEIKRLDVRIGDTVIIQKAGDIIPDILEVVKELRTGKEKSFVFPKTLEACGGPIERIPGQAAYRCVNKNSIAQHKRRLYYFVGKQALDIKGCGPKVIDLLLDHNLIDDFADLFTLKKGDLIDLPRLGEKSVDNLLVGINQARRITLDRLITALSIDQVGEETAIDLADYFGELDKIREAPLDVLENIDGIGEVVAKSIFDWFRDKKNIKRLNNLLKHLEIIKEVGGNSLSGKSFVFTGTIDGLSRDQAKKMVRDLGGEVHSSLINKTDYLVVGDKPGSKYKQAQSLNIKILTKKDFLDLVS